LSIAAILAGGPMAVASGGSSRRQPDRPARGHHLDDAGDAESMILAGIREHDHGRRLFGLAD
jgi:hypothetical protein